MNSFNADLVKLKELYGLQYLTNDQRKQYSRELKLMSFVSQNDSIKYSTASDAPIGIKGIKKVVAVLSKSRRQKLTDDQLFLIHIAYLEDKKGREIENSPPVEALWELYLEEKQLQLKAVEDTLQIRKRRLYPEVWQDKLRRRPLIAWVGRK